MHTTHPSLNSLDPNKQTQNNAEKVYQYMKISNNDSLVFMMIFAGSQAPAWKPCPGSSSFPSFSHRIGVKSCPEAATYRVQYDPCPHFLTATVNHWLPLFTRPETVNILLDSWRFLQREAGSRLYGYVILENHLHLIAASGDLSRDMQRFKSYTAKKIIALLEQQPQKLD
jgi:hypothetical protein